MRLARTRCHSDQHQSGRQRTTHKPTPLQTLSVIECDLVHRQPMRRVQMLREGFNYGKKQIAGFKSTLLEK